MSGRRVPRLWVAAGLAAGGAVALSPGQAHHLRTVLRLAPGAAVAAFNATDGEWLCRLGETAAHTGMLVVEHALRPAQVDVGPWLLFAPIKRPRLEWLIEKATELGAEALLPVWTRHAQREPINLQRLFAHAVLAAEQSERLSVPALAAPQPLDAVLAEWPAERLLIVCDETGAGRPMARAIARLGAGPAALLTGPEGGLDETELDRLGKLPFVTRVGLGPRVLRADTAAVAALSVFQAIVGDWRRPRSR